MKLIRSLLIAAFAIVSLGGCEKKPTNEAGTKLQPFQILLDWQPEPTYLGVYYAKEKGYFRDLGLDVEIVPSWGANQAVTAVAAGKYSIATASGGATVLGYNNDAQIVSLGVIYPKIPSVIYGLADKNVSAPKDLVGKKIGLYPGSITVNEFDAFLKLNGINKDEISIVSLSGADIPLLREGQVDAVLHYHEMSPVTVELDPDFPSVEGRRTFSLRLSEHGVPGYGLNIVTSRETLEKEADLVRNVSDAMIRGYEEARRNPEDATAVFTRLFPEKTEAYVKESLGRVNSMLGETVGAQNPEGWQETIGLYKSLGLLTKDLTPSDILP